MKKCIFFNEFITSNSSMINLAQSFNDYSSISSFLHEQITTYCLIIKLKLSKCKLREQINPILLLVRNVGGRHQTTVPLSKRNFLMNKLFLNRFSNPFQDAHTSTFSTWILRRPKRVVKIFRLDIYDKSEKILNIIELP